MTEKPVDEQIAEDRAHYISHPQDDEWADAPPPDETSGKRPVGTMVSVRLSASEADEIRVAAEAAGRPVSAFIRQVVLNHVRGRPGIDLGMTLYLGNFSRVVTQVDLAPGVPLSGGVQSTSVSAVA